MTPHHRLTSVVLFNPASATLSPPDRCLTVEQAMRQLRYRYDRELDRCERPALRRITEGDDTAAKTLILLLAEVNAVRAPACFVVDGVKQLACGGEDRDSQ